MPLGTAGRTIDGRRMSPTPEPSLHLRRTAIAEGWSDDELGRLVRAGELERLRRGAYVAGPLPADVAAVHRLLVRATLSGLRRPAVVSHQSAAVLHGLRCGTHRWIASTSPARAGGTTAAACCASTSPGCGTTR